MATFGKYLSESFLRENNIEVKFTKSVGLKKFFVKFYFQKLLPIDAFVKYVNLLSKFKENILFDDFPIEYQFYYRDLALEDDKLYLSYLDYLSKDDVRFRLILTSIEHADGHFILRESHANYANVIENLFNKYMIEVKFKIVEDKDIQKIIEEKEALEEEKRQELCKTISDKRQEEQSNMKMQQALKDAQKEGKKNYNKTLLRMERTKIVDIPSTISELDEYINTIGKADFCISGTFFNKEVVNLKRKNSYLYTLAVTDGTSSIMVKKFVEEAEKETFDALKPNEDILVISGYVQNDTYSREITFMARNITVDGKYVKEIKLDNAKEKRIELHLHTNMSALDGLSSVEKYVKRAKLLGHEALAFTDHDGIYAYHDIMGECKKAGIKPIYGVELSFVDEDKFNIAYTVEDIDLKDATYVVFDLETTGLSIVDDEIIQIAASKLQHGQIIESLNIFVNPHRPIPKKVVSLTSITDDMVKDADELDVALNKFLRFSEGSILVAQNASFDVGHIYEKMRRLGIEVKHKFPVIDTMQLARNFYANELKTFNLKSLAKYFKVVQEHHHLADDDTRVTAEIFLQMLQTLYKNNIYNYKDINASINKEEAYKHVIPSHINILVQNQVGYKNLFKIISDALTTHYSNEPRLLKSVLNQYREGLLVGSGCRYGDVFEYALNKNDEDLEKAIAYCDYIELQPLDIYRDMLNRVEKDGTVFDDIDYFEVAKKAALRIIDKAHKLNKIVVATSDCHYIDKEDKFYREIYITAPQLGGGIHPLLSCATIPDQYYRTTDEMLAAFDFLGQEKALEIVVTNTHKIADMIEDIVPFKDGKDDLYSPKDDEFKDSLGVPSIKDHLMEIVYKNAYQKYGNPLPKFVSDRLDKELNSIISNGYSPVYYMAYLLVKKSNDDGYVVGSRGSVGSSFVATMMDITEVNPLPPHYYCPNCHFSAFKFNAEEKAIYHLDDKQKLLDEILQKSESGFDLPKTKCPCCGTLLKGDGQDIPFETFLGFKGDKTPDIDLNFSGDYQPTAHEFVRTLMGPDRAFRAGTVSAVQTNTAIGYVKHHCERKNINIRNTEVLRIAKHLEGVRRTTGQHPGGIVVVPSYKEIYDVTPIQFPADKLDSTWRTTHFEYHNFEANLLKLDILGHDDPTTLRFLFDYVEEHPEEFPFTRVNEIPLDDLDVYKMFSQTEVLGLSPEDISSEVATYALPEFGTSTTRQMLIDTRPKTFADLVKISGLAHGTNVWANNTQELVLGRTDYGRIPFSDVIGCRDDIMVYLISCNLPPADAFAIMEFVRKGKAADKANAKKWDEFVTKMRSYNVPEWYIWSCSKIEYMFPKAHAVAYVLSAMRISWFKLHKPLLFYSAFFSIRIGQFEPENMLAGVNIMRQRIAELGNIRNRTAKEDDLLTMYQVAVEMLKRGFNFLPVDIMKSEAKKFNLEGNCLRLPFVSVPGLGDSVAYDIVEKRKERPFNSKKDVSERTRLNKTLFEKFEEMHAFADLPDESDELLFGLFDIN